MVEALKRAESVAAADRICPVVSERHRCWWEPALSHLPRANVIVQPDNRGTAIGILLPLLYVLHRDPEARVVLLPSDHHIREEHILAAAMQASARELVERRDHILLIGIAPDEADPELGYIVPGIGDRTTSMVDRFVEKPNRLSARSLVDGGALWNTFIVAASGAALLRLFVNRMPLVVALLEAAVAQSPDPIDPSQAMFDAYTKLPIVDFSREVLQGAEPMLRVMEAARCGWSDLGTPRRLAQTLKRLPPTCHSSDYSLDALAGILNLAAQAARLRTA
jgi:mannose-1-phosphate guanylyltransferase